MHANVRQEIETSSHWLVGQIRVLALVFAYKQLFSLSSDLKESRGWGTCQAGDSQAFLAGGQKFSQQPCRLSSGCLIQRQGKTSSPSSLKKSLVTAETTLPISHHLCPLRGVNSVSLGS